VIKGITQSGRYVTVSGGQSTNYINNYSGAQGVGNLRFNTTNQTMEVYDGNAWQQLSMSYASIGLNSEAESLLDWAREERNRHWAREAKMKNNPALRKAWEAVQRAEENFDLIYKFVEHDNESAESEQVQSSP